MVKKAAIVVGAGYGDEGKGLVTDFLCSRFRQPLVIRFNGGHQAGHTVVDDLGRRHVFSHFGAGSLRGIPTYWSAWCTCSPASLIQEYQALINIGVQPLLYLDGLCPVTTFYDALYNRLLEQGRGTAAHGSCGLGFGATVERHQSPAKVFAQDLLYPGLLFQKLQAVHAYYEARFRQLGPSYLQAFQEIDIEANKAALSGILQVFNVLVKEGAIRLVTGKELFDPTYGWDQLIFEGAQGILLDMDAGVFPHVTYSNTSSRQALSLAASLAGLRPEDTAIYYVSRCYHTRHGNGPLEGAGQAPELIHTELETNVHNEFQGHFRRAPLSLDLLRYALSWDHHFSAGAARNLVITCTDQLPDGRASLLINDQLKQVPYRRIPGFLGFGPEQTWFGSGPTAAGLKPATTAT